MKIIKLGTGNAYVHTGGECCASCREDEAGFDAWYAERFPEQAAAKTVLVERRGA